MSNPSSNNLKLHIEDSNDLQRQLDLPAWLEIRNSLEKLTGQALEIIPKSQLGHRQKTFGEIPDVFNKQPGCLIDQRASQQKSSSRASATAQRRLAESLAAILQTLQTTRMELRLRETELATAIPVIGRLDNVDDFNFRLEEILRGTVEGLRGAAAAVYLLDDETTQLKLRLHWGLNTERFIEPPRPLRGAVADLEALAGHAVVLEDASLFNHWGVPEAFPSAVCVPISSPDTLLGTLWFFGSEVRDYCSRETQLLEIVAGRLAAELERQILIRDAVAAKRTRNQGEALVHWHEERLRQVPPVLDDWQVSGAMVNGQQPRGDFHAWRLTDSDLMTLSSAAISGPVDKSMLTSSLLQGAIRMAMLHTSPPCQVLRAINDVLWSSAPDSAGVAMFYGQLDLPSGRLRYLTAGSTDAYILRPHGWEPIMGDSGLLGASPDWSAQTDLQTIHPGDVLLVVSDRQLSTTPATSPFCTTALAEKLLRHIHLTAEQLTELAQKLIGQHCESPSARSLLIVKRAEPRNLEAGEF